MKKFCYSTNEEEFYGEFNSRHEAANEAFSDDDSIEACFTAEVVHARTFLDRMDTRYIGDEIVERLDEQLYDNIGGDDVILILSDDASKELGEIIIKFIKEHGDFQRWGVDHVSRFEKITV